MIDPSYIQVGHRCEALKDFKAGITVGMVGTVTEILSDGFMVHYPELATQYPLGLKHYFDLVAVGFKVGPHDADTSNEAAG